MNMEGRENATFIVDCEVPAGFIEMWRAVTRVWESRMTVCTRRLKETGLCMWRKMRQEVAGILD